MQLLEPTLFRESFQDATKVANQPFEWVRFFEWEYITFAKTAPDELWIPYLGSDRLICVQGFYCTDELLAGLTTEVSNYIDDSIHNIILKVINLAGKYTLSDTMNVAHVIVADSRGQRCHYVSTSNSAAFGRPQWKNKSP